MSDSRHSLRLRTRMAIFFSSIRVHHCILAVLLIFIIISRNNDRVGEWYSIHAYPIISTVLSFIVSWLPFSLEEVTVILTAFLIIYVFIKKRRRAFLKTIELLIWIYVWFYIGWGCNYFRQSIYSRTDTERQVFDETTFRNFIHTYADNLNTSFDILPEKIVMDINSVESSVKDFYDAVPKSYGLASPQEWQHPKKLLFNGLYSSVGVMGFIGPFFCETQLNKDLLPCQYPFVYAHEYSHLLGVSSEDEANFWGYQSCIASDIPEVRYSGYYSMLPYVLSNAYRVLSPNEYRAFVNSLHPEIIEQYNKQRDYWNSLYSPVIGWIQNTVYDIFLKSNKVTSGTANYLEVIDMIISVPYTPSPQSNESAPPEVH